MRASTDRVVSGWKFVLGSFEFLRQFIDAHTVAVVVETATTQQHFGLCGLSDTFKTPD